MDRVEKWTQNLVQIRISCNELEPLIQGKLLIGFLSFSLSRIYVTRADPLKHLTRARNSHLMFALAGTRASKLLSLFEKSSILLREISGRSCRQCTAMYLGILASLPSTHARNVEVDPLSVTNHIAR